MRVGLTLSGDNLSSDGAKFAAQLGVTDVVIHLNTYGKGTPEEVAAWNAGEVGPPNAPVITEPLWDYERMSGVVGMLAEHGLKVAALENFSPRFWSDVLLNGPDKREQMDGLKRLVRDAGKAGIPVIGYNFSLAGVWGWRRVPSARAGAWTVEFDMSKIDHEAPIPDGMIWNMRYREGRAGASPVTVGHDELWQRLEWFLRELVPVAEEAGVKLAAHPDDPPADFLRGTARLVNSHGKYDRLLDLVRSPANALEFCIGSLAEMPGDIYDTTRHFAQRRSLAYVHFRNVRGKVPHYVETFVDEGDVDMTEIVRILRDENYDGVLVPDHVPDLHGSKSPWHAGNAYTVGFMRALILNQDALGPSWSATRDTQEN